jgi:hypothetical protein
MPTQTIPLNDLTQRITQQEAKLEQMRQQYAARQKQLVELTRRKEELQNQLRQVESEMQTVTGSSPPVATAAAAAQKPTPTPTTTDHPTLPAFLVEVVREAGRRMTVPELADEVVRRNFPTTSTNIPNLVGDATKKLVKRGVFRRAKDKPGVVLAKPTSDRKAHTTKKAATPPKPTTPKSPAAAKSAAKPSASNKQKSRSTLRAVLTELLAKAKQPVLARDLAEQALAAGYTRRGIA